MKTEFVSQVSHELRTPLTAIKGFTELLLDEDAGEINDEQQEYLGIVKSNVDRLVALINDLLDISRIESGRIALRLEPIDLGEIVRSVGRSLQPLIDAKAQVLQVAVATDLGPAVGDYDRIVQVVTNLLSNACKYTPCGRLAAADRGRSGRRRSGHGPGQRHGHPGRGSAPPVQSLFPRRQLADPRDRGHWTRPGHRQVDRRAARGYDRRRSEVGTGSTFSFTLPLVSETPSPVVERTPTAVARELEHTSRLGDGPLHRDAAILVVDDDPLVVARLAEQLARAGYQTRAAVGAAAALDAIATARPDLIAIGIGMTGRGSLQTAQQIMEVVAGTPTPVSFCRSRAAAARRHWPGAPGRSTSC